MACNLVCRDQRLNAEPDDCTTADAARAFYARASEMTDIGAFRGELEGRLREPGLAAACRLATDLMIHEFRTRAPGTPPSPPRHPDAQLRSASQMLAEAKHRPLTVICRHFAVLMCALLRMQGMPARVRCGYASYLRPGHLVEHWACECWSAVERRSVLCDASGDDSAEFDKLDVRRDQFTTAGELWLSRRATEFDAGTAQALANDVLRDFAALNKVEVQPWHAWGAMCHPADSLTQEQLTLVDRLASLTRNVDRDFELLRQTYQTELRVRVPATVFNTHFLYGRDEPLFG